MRGWCGLWGCGLAVAFAVIMAAPGTAQTAAEADKLNAEVLRLYQAAKYIEAIPIAQRVLALREKLLGPNHPDVGASLNFLASLYERSGRYAEAEPLFNRSLELSEKASGPDHPDVGMSLNNLAGLYTSQGRYADAEPLYKRSLAVREKALGPDHPHFGTSLNDLAGLYRAQGRYAEAEPLLKRGLAIVEKAFGPDHTEVGVSLNNLAGLYREQGRYAEAEPLFKRSMALLEKVLGPDHPHVAATLNNLAGVYESQGRLADAEPLYNRSLAQLEKAFGPDHPHVGVSLNNLAGVLKSQGRFAEAEPLFKRSLALREKSLGPDHPDVGASLNDLARLYWIQGRYAEAEPLYKRSVSVLENGLGLGHPDVGWTLNNLAQLYRAQRRYDEAEPLYQRSLEIWENTLGADRRAGGTLLNDLAGLYREQRRYTEAELLFKRSLALREESLSPSHPDVGMSLNNLAGLYREQGRHAEAEPLYTRSLAILENGLGPDHPNVGIAIEELAHLYRAQGRYADAEVLYNRGLALHEKALGFDHPYVAASLNSLASFALSQDRLDEAADRWRQASALFQRRAERGISGASDELSNGETQRYSQHFKALVKTTHRLMADDIADAQTMEMFQIAQWAVGSEAAASLAKMASRSAGGSPELAALIRERQDLVSEWRGKDKTLLAAKTKLPANREAVGEKALTDRLASIDARLTAIDARLAKDFPDFAAIASPKPISVLEVQAILRDDEALLFFLDTDDRLKPLPEETFVWVVTKKTVNWLRSELGTVALAREVAALRCGLDAAAWNDGVTECSKLVAQPSIVNRVAGDLLPFDAARAYALYKGLLGDVTDVIKGKHLLVVPSGALTKLPLQVLVTEPPMTYDPASTRWLIHDHAITVLPSVSSLKALRHTAKPSDAPKQIIGFGNPLLEGDQAHPQYGAYFKQQAAIARDRNGCAKSLAPSIVAIRAVSRSSTMAPQLEGRLANLDHLRVQSPLPETVDELCEVARILGGSVEDIWVGARARESEVKRLSNSGQLAKYRILHFATHGTLAGQLTGTHEPGLILSPPPTATAEDDGYLSGSEIAGLKLDADWVILSACNTAGGADQGEAAEALSGLARVFFYAGARALLVSHWEVDSEAAVELVAGAIEAMAKDKKIGRAEALRRSILAVMAETQPAGRLPGWHPSVWAPFVLVGEGGPGRWPALVDDRVLRHDTGRN